MAYYLGRDIKVWSLLEINNNKGLATDATNGVSMTTAGTAGSWAYGLHVDGLADTYALGDVTGVDLSIGTTDEDITYVGQRSVLKAEIKKETTLSLTRKKSNLQWDVLFNGPVKSGDEQTSGTLDHGARWGVTNQSGSSKISDGRMSPKDHSDAGTGLQIGYRMVVKLNSSEFFVMRNAQITGHTVTLNADGTTEETLELMTHVTPQIKAAIADCVAATSNEDA